MQSPEKPSSEPASAPVDLVYCLLCGEPLAGGSWCNKCQLSREAIERIFRAEKVEEARSPCAPLVVLGLVVMAVMAAVTVVVCAGLMS